MLTTQPIRKSKRATWQCCPFFVFIILVYLFNVNTTAATELDEARLLAKSGAASLAIHLIEQQQKPIDPALFAQGWEAWESARLDIYEQGQLWQELVQRVAGYPATIARPFLLKAKERQVNALLKLGQGAQARQILQQLIWANNPAEPGPEQLALWQHDVIRSYLAEGKTEDAHLAAQRYYQDYDVNQIEEQLLRARILLMNQRNDEAVNVLEKMTDNPEGGMLYLVAQLRSNARPARKVLQSALRQMQGKWVSEELKYYLWAVVAEAARNSGDRPSTVNGLEHTVAGDKDASLPAGLFDFTADTLWNAYLDYAIFIGNRAQYLIGNDQQWLEAAQDAEKKFPVKARSLYALVILKAQTAEARLQAAQGFLALMRKRRRGGELVNQLFLHSRYFPTYQQIPEPIRYDLVDILLSRSNITQASQIMATIVEPPVGTDSFQWQLRRARIFVLGGEPAQGAKVLNQLLVNENEYTREQVDQLLQVVFDLQTIQQHDLAQQLFQRVIQVTSDKALHREIYYWMADSEKARKQYAEAARLYLRSAMFLDEQGLDPWGQTARYQAAEMLAKARMLRDARKLFEDLLATTTDAARVAVLKHELQKLWLLQQ